MIKIKESNHFLHLTKDQFVEKYKEVFKNKYEIVGEWVNSETKTTIKCKKCSKKWNTYPYNVAVGIAKCPYCEGAKTNYDTLYLSELCKEHDFEVLSECTCAKDIVLFKHNKCGNTFKKGAKTLTRHYSCPYCTVNSRGEEEIVKVLNKYNLNFKREVTFKDLRGTKGGCLRFDFGIYNSKNELLCLIEYDGKQHEEDVGYKYFGESYNKTVTHDSIKNEYCKNNNYKLLRISYHQRRTIEKVLLIFLEKNNII